MIGAMRGRSGDHRLCDAGPDTRLPGAPAWLAVAGTSGYFFSASASAVLKSRVPS